ncbi:MAG: hypothetical protein DMG05_17405, partial [Acidobacteria bacterium]
MRSFRLFLKLLYAGMLACLCFSVCPCLRDLYAIHFQNDSGGERRRGDRTAIEMSSGARVEFSKFYSPALKGDAEYSIFLPPSYGKDNKSYPVVYFLHGLWNDHT